MSEYSPANLYDAVIIVLGKKVKVSLTNLIEAADDLEAEDKFFEELIKRDKIVFLGPDMDTILAVHNSPPELLS